MEERHCKHIWKNLDALIRNTTCHSLFLAFLEGKNVVGQPETTLLNSIEHRYERTKKFYQLIITKSESFNVLCEALQNTKQSGAYDILIGVNPIRFDVRQPVHLFTGREKELTKLHEHMSQVDNPATLITQAASVTGLGGIGKTELSRMYIQKYSENYGGNVIWIGADKITNMENSFKTLAKDYLRISLKDVDGGDKDIQTVVDEVYNYFQDKKSLFVFDNAVTSNRKQLDIFLPKRVSKAPSILITSRDKDWELPMNVLVLDELKENEAIEFVKKGLNIEDSGQDSLITELVKRLQCFPLALQQAISFIRQQRKSKSFEIGEYLNFFEAETKELLNYELSLFLSNKYAMTTFTTWKITTDVIATDKEDGSLAISILNMISYFDPDKIPTNMFVEHEITRDEDKIHAALQLLIKYSMISCQPMENTLNIHRLVQEVTRIEIGSEGKEEITLRECLNIFNGNVDDKSVTHAISTYEYVHSYPTLIIESSRLPSKILELLNQLKRLNEAQLFGEKAYPVLLNYVPTDNIDVARTQFQFARVRLEQYNYVDSQTMLEEALEKYRAQNSTADLQLEMADIKQCIAKTLLFAGKTNQAIPAFTEAYQNRMENKHATHNAKNALELIAGGINCLLDIGEYEYCLSHWEKHLELYVGRMGQVEMKIVAYIKLQISFVYEKMGDSDKCVSMAMEAYQEATPWFDTDVQLTEIGYEVGRILANLEKYPEAIDIATNVYECRCKSLEPIHMSTLFSLSQLGDFKQRADLTDEAIPILQDAHNRLAMKVGAHHIMTLETKMDLAMCKAVTGYGEEAFSLASEILQVFWKQYGPQSDILLNATIRIVAILIRMEANGDALALNKELERIITVKGGANDTRLAQIREVIGSLESRGNLNKLESGNVAALLAKIYLRCRVTFPDFDAFKSEQARLDTFIQSSTWSIEFIKPEDCAKAGFFFLQYGDYVQCAYCRGVISNWEQGDDPRMDHKKHYPECPFVANETNENL